MPDAGAPADQEFVEMVERPSLAEVEAWIGERILTDADGDGIRTGTLWAGAYLDALEEMAAGHDRPSPEYRRRYALPLGLQRMLAADEPHLHSGLALRP